MANVPPDAETYRTSDHAATHNTLKPGPERGTAIITSDFKTLMREGYVIIERLLDQEVCDHIKSAFLPHLNHTGRNPFEGIRTQRVYDVLSKTRAVDALAEHPRVLGLLDRLFQPNFLLSQSQAINIHSGEDAQMLHYDDAFYRMQRPRPPLGAATIWAIDEFTQNNGATVIIPQSHKWGDDVRPDSSQQISVVMPAGSVVVFLGTTWHGGGQNASTSPRLAITHQYCEPFLRQQENFFLELSKEIVEALSPQMQSLIGYSIYPPFMGMVAGKHPLRSLNE